MVSDQKIATNIEDEIRSSYLDYAMSVIVGRALPDVRDGLKPVHRRVLYSMHEASHHYNRSYVKSARVVGDVMSQLHPHGDQAIYDSLVRMAQNFSMRYLLVDGQGNFGSIDGDPPAAMRYTEVRLQRVSSEILADIEKETVDWKPSYDEKKLEPTVLPTRVPNLLMNGSEGIAVGMATKIPPHNLGELLSALIALAENPAMELRDLIAHIPGPDFPTAGFIYGRQGIYEAYATGRGKVTVRAKIDIETNAKTDRESVVISEVPYQVNKARLMEEIAQCVRDKKIEGVSDLRDESDKDGLRVVIDLKRDAASNVIVNQLYGLTQCSITFGINMLAIVAGRPRTLSLKEMLEEFLEHRREVVTRRCRFEKREAEARAHILEGLLLALDHIDAIINTIRASRTQDEAREALIAGFSLSERQAQAILDMRLARLTGLEREKIQAEYNELLERIAWLTRVLGDANLLRGIIVDEFRELRERYGDTRRTVIVDDDGEFTVEDLIAEEDMVVTVSHEGYIKRNPLTEFRAQRRGGKGVIGMETKEGDFVEQLYVATTHNYFLVFTNLGKLYWLKVYQIPMAGRASRGRPVINLIDLSDAKEKVQAILPVREFVEGRYIVMVTRRGFIKKTDLMAFSNVRSAGIIALDLEDDDDLVFAGLSDGTQDIMVATRGGLSIRFAEDDVRPMGRTARGVKAIAIEEGDAVVDACVIAPEKSVLTICENGYGKRSPLEEYPTQGRAGRGVITIKTTERNGDVVSVMQVGDGEHLMMISASGKIIRIEVEHVSVIGRNTQGVRLVDLADDDRLIAVSRLEDPDRDEDLPEAPPRTSAPVETGSPFDDDGANGSESGEADEDPDAN